MKKGISFILALVMCLSLCACSKECDCGCAYCCGENVKNIIETSVLPSQEPEEGVTNADSDVAYRFDGTNTGDVTVEEVVVRPHTVGYDGGYFFDWEMKVRNTGSEDTIPDETVLRVWFRYLDENGDVIAETQSEAGKYSPVKSGQAEWIQINTRLGSMDSSEVEATAFIEIFAYTKKVRTKPEVYYENPILIDIRNFVKE